MQRRDAIRTLTLSAAASAAAISTSACAPQACSSICFPQTTEEIAAKVFPSNQAYCPGDIRRYHAGGTDWTGALASLRTVGAHGLACFIPKGTYSYRVSPNWAVAGLDLTGERGTILEHTGTGVAFNMDCGATGAVIDGLVISNLIIKGNAATTDGVYSRGIVRSLFRMIEVRGCSGKAFHIRHGVSNHYDTCIVSTNVAPWKIYPTHAFYLSNNGAGYYTAGCTFTNCIGEGFPGKGCALADASGNTFVGGTFEKVEIGLDIDTDDCRRNRFVSVWFEANSVADARIKGVGNSFSNCYFGSSSSGPTVLNSTGAATLFEGGFIRVIAQKNTARDTLFTGVVFSNHPALGVVGSSSYRMVGCTEADKNLDVTTSLPDHQVRTAEST